jgi:hypothetical protein
MADFADGLDVVANVLTVPWWVFISISIADTFGSKGSGLRRVTSWLVVEMLPWAILIVAVETADSLVRHRWVSAVLNGVILVLYLLRWHHNDDDRWKRRRRRLVEKVKQLGSRLVVAPSET